MPNPKPAPAPCRHCGQLIEAQLVGYWVVGENKRPHYIQIHQCPVLIEKADSPYSNIAGGPNQ